MNPGDTGDLVAYRLEQADEAVKEAEALLSGGFSLRSVMNRIYFSMFYAVLALLQREGLGTSKHSGAISLFDREYIKPGTLPQELSRDLHRAFELRQSSDYKVTSELSREHINEFLPKAKRFVTAVKNLLLSGDRQGDAR